MDKRIKRSKLTKRDRREARGEAFLSQPKKEQSACISELK